MAVRCSRKPCALLNVIISVATLVVGISLFVVGGAFQNDKFYQTEGQLQTFSTQLFIGCIIMGCVTILGSICGCAAGFIPNRCFAIMFGLLITPIWIVFLVMALSAGGIMRSSDEGL